MWDWFVSTREQPGDRFRQEYEYFFGGQEEQARREFLNDRKIPQFWTRQLVKYGRDVEHDLVREVVVEERVITRRLTNPPTYSGSFRSSLEQWREEDNCKVSAALLGGKEWTTNEFADYITIRGDMLTYCPDGKQQLKNDDGSWKNDNRQEMKPARLARKLIVESRLAYLTDADFERFANIVKAAATAFEDSIKIVSGPDIAANYLHSSYAPGGTSLQRSCMRYDRCQDYFGIYTENPNKVSMVVMFKNGKVLARALLWTLDTGEKFLDRIYGPDHVIEKYKDYAKAQGWYCKRDQSYMSNIFHCPDGTTREVTFFVTLDKFKFTKYPYMDTMQYLDRSRTGRLTNSVRHYHTSTMRSTEGSIGGPSARTTEFVDPEMGRGTVNSISAYCHRCSAEVRPRAGRRADGHTYCLSCYNLLYRACDNCGSAELRDTFTEVGYGRSDVCIECRETRTSACLWCHNRFMNNDLYYSADGTGRVCDSCRSDHRQYCDVCGDSFVTSPTDTERVRCMSCQDELSQAEDDYEPEYEDQ